MCNCLYNLLCPNQNNFHGECNGHCHGEFHNCNHRCNRRGATYTVFVQEMQTAFANNYGPSTVNFETPNQSVPYVYQYQGRQGGNGGNATTCPCLNQRTCGNLYIVNEIY